MARHSSDDGSSGGYPIGRHGRLWWCDGPDGRFFAHTKAELLRLLAETGGANDERVDADNEARNRRRPERRGP